MYFSTDVFLYCTDVFQYLMYLCISVSDKTIKLCEKYARVKGPGSIARPEHHPFFQKLAPMIKLHLDKSERENGFM